MIAQQKKYEAERPWPMPRRDQCYFYQTMRYPDGEVIDGNTTIPDFANYIGNYDLRGKTVLDVGTSTGFIAFNAERAGATVTALDPLDPREIRQVPFAGALPHEDFAAWCEWFNLVYLARLKNSFWYSWHKYNSRVKVFYRPLETLRTWDQRFDVVIAGAVVINISDPISAIGYWAKVANEAIIIPFTPTIGIEDLVMRPASSWNSAKTCHVWWNLSHGLYRRVFGNLGFDVEFLDCRARQNDPAGLAFAGPGEANALRLDEPFDAVLTTIVARRRQEGTISDENLLGDEQGKEDVRLARAYWRRYPDVAGNDYYGERGKLGVMGARRHFEECGRDEGRIWGLERK